MVKFLVLYNTPEDPEAFERHYRDVHIPLTKKLPGLRRYTIGRHATAVLRGDERERDQIEAAIMEYHEQQQHHQRRIGIW